MRLLISASVTLLLPTLLPAAVELTDANRISIERVENRGDSFIGKFKNALDHSQWNGTKIEDRLNAWTSILEKATDEMKNGLHDKNASKVDMNFRHAMIVAAGLNRVMLMNEFRSAASADWNDLRSALNDIAMRSGEMPLPDLVITTVDLTPALLDRDEVKDVMKRIEASTDRFKDKFEQGLKAAHSGREYSQYQDWADTLEDVTDQMLDHYKGHDTKKFNESLQTSLMFAEAINRLMMTKEVFGGAPQEWIGIRTDLNTVARAFGQPVLFEW